MVPGAFENAIGELHPRFAPVCLPNLLVALGDVLKLGNGGRNRRGWCDTGRRHPVLQANYPHKRLMIDELAFEWVDGAGHAITSLRLPGAGLAAEGDCHAHHPISGVWGDGVCWDNLGIVEISPKLSRLVTATDGTLLAREYLAKPDPVSMYGIGREFGWGGRIRHHPQAFKRRCDGLVVGVDGTHPDLVASLVDHDLDANVGLAGLEFDGDFA